ncbi:tail fiber domain-containing protein [Citrobacter freundii]|uniref:tail fiber domain-containing protein n=1 Tax=Citrobacter freundii TaxID=546 RepID=UPI00339D2CF3
MIYNTGTISINGNTATGTGTNWTAAASQIRVSQTIIVLSNPVQMFQITAINSSTSLTVTPAASPALSGQKYGILVTDSLSVDGLAQSISQLINEYDENIGGWETFATTSANQNITVTINGKAVTIPAIGGLARKGSNSDITELKGLTTALSVAQGGTGATSEEGARANLGLDNVATKSDGAVPVNQGGTGRTDGKVSFAGYISDGGVYSSYQYRPSQLADGSGSPLNAIGGFTYLQCAIDNDSSVSNVELIRRRADGSQVGQIIVSFPKNSGTLAVQGTSGRDYKTDITPADNKEALSRVMSLEMVNFVYKDDEQQRLRFGIIAEDAERVAPQYIKHNRVPIEGTEVFDSEGNKTGEEYQDRPSIDNNPIIMDLLGVAQYQQKMINDMAESIKTLESRLT